MDKALLFWSLNSADDDRVYQAYKDMKFVKDFSAYISSAPLRTIEELDVLIELLQHAWKPARSRTKTIEQPKPELGNLPGVKHSGNSLKASQAAPQFPNRAKWLRQQMEEREWNKHRFRECNGPDHDTIQRILDGLKVHEGTIEKVINVLNFVQGNRRRLTINDVPED